VRGTFLGFKIIKRATFFSIFKSRFYLILSIFYHHFIKGIFWEMRTLSPHTKPHKKKIKHKASRISVPSVAPQDEDDGDPYANTENGADFGKYDEEDTEYHPPQSTKKWEPW
jgi:hypothetical protein